VGSEVGLNDIVGLKVLDFAAEKTALVGLYVFEVGPT
jgi:hypothetical protein